MSFDHITRTALERATASVEGARHIGSQLSGYAGTNVQTLLEAIIGRVLPSGGTTGQALTKSSNTDYAVGWTTASGGSPPFADNTALVKDDADATKLVRVDAGTVATGTTRVLTFPNADVNLGALTDSNIASANKDGVVGTASMRTLGTGAQQAAPGNDTRFPSAAFAYYAIPFAFDGTLPASNTGRLKGIVWKTGTITKVFAKVRTAPTTQSILIDLNLNGTTIWSTQGNRVAIAAAGTSGTQTTFNTTAVTEDDYVTCDIDQAGSGTTGADLTVFLVIRYAL